MHRCLKLLEIVDMIFSHLYVPPDINHTVRPSNRPELRALAALARTSTFFSDVALDLLWRSAVLINVLRCLPADLWSINEESSNKMVFLRPLLKTDWTRVSMYASRVRELSPGSDDLTNILPVLSLCLPGDLFPNLRALHWESTDIMFPYIDLFLDTTIGHISFHSSQSALSLLPFLPEKCPNLTTFEMTPSLNSSDWDSPHEIQAVTAFACGLKSSIESLSVPIASTRALEHICHLPNLKLLGLDTFPPGMSFPAVEGPTYQALHTLHLHYTRVEGATNFLTMFHEVPLSSLTACLVPHPTADESDSFCADLVAGFRDSALRILTYFHNLTSVAIYGKFDLENAVILDIAHRARIAHFDAQIFELEHSLSKLHATRDVVQARLDAFRYPVASILCARCLPRLHRGEHSSNTPPSPALAHKIVSLKPHIVLSADATESQYPMVHR
ncbi:hypothetical protein C8R46DRAFT_1341966 [Mycena filopes]|nr:hypothetical protein C8R46DRAFT_1341966 [Mycena filopes]